MEWSWAPKIEAMECCQSSGEGSLNISACVASQSEIVMAELKEYRELPSRELYEEMKLHLFS